MQPFSRGWIWASGSPWVSASPDPRSCFSSCFRYSNSRRCLSHMCTPARCSTWKVAMPATQPAPCKRAEGEGGSDLVRATILAPSWPNSKTQAIAPPLWELYRGCQEYRQQKRHWPVGKAPSQIRGCAVRWIWISDRKRGKKKHTYMYLYIHFYNVNFFETVFLRIAPTILELNL